MSAAMDMVRMVTSVLDPSGRLQEAIDARTNIRPATHSHSNTVYQRPCDRCGDIHPVRNPAASRNLCRDCLSVLTPEEIARWVS